MSGSPTLLAAAAAAVALLLAPALGFFFAGLSDRRRALLAGLAVLGTLSFATISWLAYGADPFVALFQGAIAVVAVMNVIGIGFRVGRPAAYMLFALLWVVAVVVPVGYALFEIHGGLLATRFGTLDFASAGVVAVCAGTAALSFAVVTGRVDSSTYTGAARPLWLLLLCGAMAGVGLVALGVGSELVIDATTLLIVVNFACGMATGTIGWTAAQLVNVRRPTVAGYVAGLLAGGIVVLAGAPWLDAGSSAILGLAAGIVGHVGAVGARSAGAGAWATPIGVLLIPGSIGILALGIVARGTGLVFSGRVGLLGSQAAGLAIVLAYSFVVALLLAFVVQRLFPPAPAIGLGASSREPIDRAKRK